MEPVDQRSALRGDGVDVVRTPPSIPSLAPSGRSRSSLFVECRNYRISAACSLLENDASVRGAGGGIVARQAGVPGKGRRGAALSRSVVAVSFLGC